MDPVALVNSLSWQFLVVCGGAAMLGGIGGIVHFFATGLAVVKPVDPGDDTTSKDKKEAAAPTTALAAKVTSPAVPLPGETYARRFAVGAVAAVAVLYLTEPTTLVALVGGSLVAGYAGQAVLTALQARVVAAIAQAETREVKVDLKSLVDAHLRLADKSVGQRSSPEARGDAAPAAQPVDTEARRLKAKYDQRGWQ